MIVQGNSFKSPLKDNSVHCAISSYPYFNLRSYPLPPTVWGGDPNCQHIWQTQVNKRGAGGEREYGSYDGAVGRGPAVVLPESAFCQLCGAWLGCFGLEPSISCENPGGGGLFELKEDLTDDERAFVISELIKLGVIR